MAEQASRMSPIDAYQAKWKPNEAQIALIKAARAKAQGEGRIGDVRALDDQLLEELRPPSHLPIKNLNVTAAEDLPETMDREDVSMLFRCIMQFARHLAKKYGFTIKQWPEK